MFLLIKSRFSVQFGPPNPNLQFPQLNPMKLSEHWQVLLKKTEGQDSRSSTPLKGNWGPDGALDRTTSWQEPLPESWPQGLPSPVHGGQHSFAIKFLEEEQARGKWPEEIWKLQRRQNKTARNIFPFRWYTICLNGLTRVTDFFLQQPPTVTITCLG